MGIVERLEYYDRKELERDYRRGIIADTSRVAGCRLP